ncbi:hypothetical protein [Bdellovibrio bacteriovorus]|uniref:hypothetical protein n=1 Tax=Bdellovibrio bacteriovorus TaxID=959 RepID=UPI003AA872F2
MEQLPKTPPSTAEKLKLMREGQKQVLLLKYNGLELPCRLLNAGEKARLIWKAKRKTKMPGEEADKVFSEAHEVMVQILAEACSVNGIPYANEDFFRDLTEPEIVYFFDQYETLLNTINPDFERLTDQEKITMIEEVKKKSKGSSDFYTWQLAEIGRYFLDRILPMVKEHGS